MSIDGFLTVPGIPGESTRAGHEDEIEVHGVTFGMEAPVARGGVARGRVSFDPVVVSKSYDRSSPALKGALATHRHLDEVVLSVQRTVEGEQADYLVVTLEDVSVVKYDLYLDTERDGVLVEQVAFTYRSVAFTYAGQYEVELEVRGAR
ncbi:Hcp family type VI secretion system effector [Ornithinimicrobium sp. LYQ92]|uniref:Hcp family type VI secretion system effector n=1 Tax=Serinicoccus sp. LYQ92 TaxID=3378798 RepID=UPI0038530929